MSDKNPFGINQTKRFVSKGAEDSLYKKHSPRSHGEVELVDYMGGDETVARVATAGHGIEFFPEKPNQYDFLKHLVTKRITEPFMPVQLKFSMQMPIRVALAFVYDRNCSVNEYSGRYSEMINSARIPSKEDLVKLVADSEKVAKIHSILIETRERTRESYDRLLSSDFARELARQGLGTNNDTRFYWLVDLHSLADFVSTQRAKLETTDPTRDYVECVAEIAENVAPDSWDSLMHGRVYSEALDLTMPLDEEIVDLDLNPASWKPTETKRIVVPDIEERLFALKKFLDHGQFQAIDYLGDDSSLAQAARTSYGVGTKKLSEDRGLIRTLVRDAHTSPIEMARLAFESRTPVFTDPRQSARHRTLKQHGFMGYTPIGNLFYYPADMEMKYQDRVNRQGRGKTMDFQDIELVRKELDETRILQLGAVKVLRALGTPEDLVRELKGVGFHTRRWRVGDTHNLGSFLRLRLDTHAQMEVRAQAQQVEEAVKAHTPIAYQAIRDYRIDSLGLSAGEIDFIKSLGIPSDENLENIEFFSKGKGFVLKREGESPKLSREGEALQKKLKRLKND